MTITINGTGTITGITAGGLPDAIITQPELATGVAGTGPAFSAYLSADQAAPSIGVWTKVAFDAEAFDTNNNFASSRFTPTVAGYYQLTVNAVFGAGVTSLTSCAFYKNGSSYKQGTTFSNLSATYVVGTSDFLYLNGSTDYIELYVYISSTSVVSGGIGGTSLAGFLARSA
jgi:hypothetical protein